MRGLIVQVPIQTCIDMAKKKKDNQLLIGGIVIAAGLGYYLYTQSQNTDSNVVPAGQSNLANGSGGVSSGSGSGSSSGAGSDSSNLISDGEGLVNQISDFF
jgi:hypothetical protein